MTGALVAQGGVDWELDDALAVDEEDCDEDKCERKCKGSFCLFEESLELLNVSANGFVRRKMSNNFEEAICFAILALTLL